MFFFQYNMMWIADFASMPFALRKLAPTSLRELGAQTVLRDVQARLQNLHSHYIIISDTVCNADC